MIAMAACPSPITAENFQSAWNYITRRYRRSVKKELARRVSTVLAQAAYFVIFLVLILGIFYEMSVPLVRAYMNHFPIQWNWWNQISGLFQENVPGEIYRILCCVGALCLVPFVITIPLAILIGLLYHPRRPKQTGDIQQDARLLHDTARRAQVAAWKMSSRVTKIFLFFAVATIVWFILGFMLYYYPDISLRDSAIIQVNQAVFRCILYGAGMIIGYRILNILLQILLNGFYFHRVPASMVTDAKDYYDEISRQEAAAAENKADA